MKIEINDNGKWQNSFTLKVLVLAVMGLFLLIPLEMIKSIIRERQNTSEEIKKEISFQWAGAQTISGPVLNIPLTIYPAKKDTDPYSTVFHIMPEDLDISGNIKTEKRHRSIYQTVVYTSTIDISGEFTIPEINTDERSEILWDEAYYSIGISDNRGLKGSVLLKTDSLLTDAVPGLRDTELFNSGITFPRKLDKNKKKIGFSISMEISGSGSLNFTPVGKTTKVRLASPWNSPVSQVIFFRLREPSINQVSKQAGWLQI